MWWKFTEHTLPHHNYAVRPLRDTPLLHKRFDAEYNGWWMCLIPVDIMKDIGLGLPIFIKFDDAEYGLRAVNAGYSVVTLPGVFVWHAAWHDKAPLKSWETYFMHRNHIIASLLYVDSDRAKKGFIRNTFIHDLQQPFTMLYSCAALRKEALDDVLKGPEYLKEILGTALPKVRQIRGEYQDSKVYYGLDELPKPYSKNFDYLSNREKKDPRSNDTKEPRPTKYFYKLFAKSAFRHLFKNVKEIDKHAPEGVLDAKDTRFYRLLQTDSVIATTPDSTGYSWYQRDRKLSRKFAKTALKSRDILASNWEKLAKEYRAADLTSMESWEKIFNSVK
jgi:galactofuranosylgalactofuranosylrhamnosyl-N-acetylglucosaminyl-diphospho-decaprenol beta-1,5/1,6-galactofuranosyltransferase